MAKRTKVTRKINGKNTFLKDRTNHKFKKMSVLGKKDEYCVEDFRKEWEEKGYELINITKLCEFRLGYSGSCNNFNNPDEEIFHVQAMYRDKNIAAITANNMYVVDDRFILYQEDDPIGNDFIIFYKARIEVKNGKKSNSRM